MQLTRAPFIVGVVLLSTACHRATQPAATPEPVPSSEPSEIRIGGQPGRVGSPPAFYVIDGAIHRPPVDLSGIDQADILTVEVIRGDGAVARFGADARSGVVVITTKRTLPDRDRPHD